MNIIDSFATLLQTLGIATLGQDLFIGNAPSSNSSTSTNPVPDDIWWIVANGGTINTSLQTGESLRDYQVNVYRRSRNYRTVYDNLYSLEETLNCNNCLELQNFNAVAIQTIAFPIDDDLDGEDRKVGLLQVNLTVYKECNYGIS